MNRRLPAFLSRHFYLIATYDDPMSLADPRWRHFAKAFETIADQGTEGDYLEFGVMAGGTFIMSYEAALDHGLDKMRFFAFDGFQGLPTTEGPKLQGSALASRKEFTDAIRWVGVDMRKVRIIEGFYADSLTDSTRILHDLTKAAVVHIDCDLYQSVKEALQFIEPIVHPGTIIIFDDWHYFETVNPVEDPENYGEQKAFLEWPLNRCFQEFYNTARSRAFVMNSFSSS